MGLMMPLIDEFEVGGMTISKEDSFTNGFMSAQKDISTGVHRVLSRILCCWNLNQGLRRENEWLKLAQS